MSGFSDNFYSFVYGSPSVPVQDERGDDTPIEECRAKDGPAECRYHGSPKYYTRLMDAMPYEKAREVLAKNGTKVSTLADFVKDDENLKACSEQMRIILRSGVKDVPRETYEKSVRAVAVVLEDLKKRFGVKIPLDVYIPTSLEDLELDGVNADAGGASEVDHIANEKSIMLFAFSDYLEYTGFCYGHNDERFPYDVIRHELGHVFSTRKNLIEGLVAIKKLELEYGEKGAQCILELEVSPNAAKGNPIETIAEVFAKRTSPDYQEGEMEYELEQFAFGVLKGEGVEK